MQQKEFVGRAVPRPPKELIMLQQTYKAAGDGIPHSIFLPSMPS